MSSYRVQKCICHDKTFEQIKAYAQENGIETAAELQDRYYCSCKCQRCLPYVERVLATGETSFQLS